MYASAPLRPTILFRVQLEDVGTSELPIATSTEPVEPVSAEASMESDSADLDDMQARLAALS